MEENENITPDEDKKLTAEEYKAMVKNFSASLKNLETSLKVMEESWMIIAREFNITDTHMKELGKYNDDHKTEMPEDISEEDKQNWDYLNGLNDIPMEEVTRIFGEDSPVHGISEEITRQHVKEIAETFFGWMISLRQYREAHDSYLELLEMEEEGRIKVLKEKAEAETDPEKKKMMTDSIDYYYNMKFLGFLTDVPDNEKERIIKALNDEKKCSYWLQRTIDKLRQYQVSPQFVMEITNFEKNYPDNDYSEIKNSLLLYFMNICIHSDAHDKKEANHSKTFCMVIALDDVIRNVWKDDKKDRVMKNVQAFYDDLLAYKKEHPDL